MIFHRRKSTCDQGFPIEGLIEVMVQESRDSMQVGCHCWERARFDDKGNVVKDPTLPKIWHVCDYHSGYEDALYMIADLRR
jgi:hypothetical protein